MTFFPNDKLSIHHYGYFLVAVLLLSAGCAKNALEYTEVKRINEPVRLDEFREFVQIVKKLPGKSLPELPPLYAPLPDWDTSRTLSVGGLVREEKEVLRQLWDERRLGRVLSQDTRLKRVLEQHEMTVEQFVGLAQTIGLAVSRSQLREDQKLSNTLRRGQETVSRLESDSRTYSTLSDDEQYFILQQAGWINRYDRARRLLLVPDKNIELAVQNEAILKEILPAEYFMNPFDSVRDLLEEFGMPFEETAESGSDADLKWSTFEAEPERIGNRSDGDFRSSRVSRD